MHRPTVGSWGSAFSDKRGSSVVPSCEDFVQDEPASGRLIACARDQLRSFDRLYAGQPLPTCQGWMTTSLIRNGFEKRFGDENYFFWSKTHLLF